MLVSQVKLKTKLKVFNEVEREIVIASIDSDTIEQLYKKLKIKL